MRLSNLEPSIPATVLACLEAQGIQTDYDLLFSATTLDIFKSLPPGTATLEELTDYTALAAEKGAALGVSAYDLLLEEQARKKDFELHTGCTELDSILQDLDGRWLIELSGDKGSGKSVRYFRYWNQVMLYDDLNFMQTVALNLLLNHLTLNPDSQALWVDTTGNFSPDRAVQIVQAKQLSTSIIERLQVTLAFDTDTVQELIEDFSQRDDAHLEFVVIDAITPLLGPLLSAASAQGHAIMIDFMRQLQAFAQAPGTNVIVINNTASKGLNTLERKPALGPSFALLTDTTLWLQAEPDADNSEDTSLHSMRILSSRSSTISKAVNFRIDGNVICPDPHEESAPDRPTETST
ncbi:hypothetical protein BDN70DRAFT_938412 [Pholiota conissans]|uniref:Rad51-like C-terminal domain-containing protein n=1 Tax=Pholiota conissans TaxID=109636 RepID=A0A9P5YQJ1_9AGAR|nr:hypothetical protein BDN70DRAFT_938412 [Pholiota conissans]